MATFTPYGFRRTKKGLVSTAYPAKWEFTIPEDFVLVIDTRELTPLFLPKPVKGLLIVRDTLKYGDYSVRGFTDTVSIERKNIDDLWSSLTRDSERFKRELDALMSYELKYILIDGMESEYLCHRPERKIHPNAIRGALAMIEAKMGIPVHQSESRESEERWLLDLLIRWFRFKRGL